MRFAEPGNDPQTQPHNPHQVLGFSQSVTHDRRGGVVHRFH